jgi:hypothetical protein
MHTLQQFSLATNISGAAVGITMLLWMHRHVGDADVAAIVGA